MVTTNTFTDDECCARHLSRALYLGELDPPVNTWTHLKCGTEWNAAMVEGVRHWTPKALVQVWPAKRS